jgi:hypothetical protein
MSVTQEQNAAIIRTMIQVMAQCDALLINLEGKCPESDFREHRQRVGRVMGAVSIDVLEPIFEEHPDLRPRDAEAWRIAGGLPEQDSTP